MCQIWLQSDGRDEKGGGGVQTDRQTNKTAVFFIVDDFLQVCSTEQVTPSSRQSIEYMLNPCRASIKHVMHSV